MMKWVTLTSAWLYWIVSLPAIADDAAVVAPPSAVTSPSGINQQFLDPELDVAEWLGRFEVESREVYAARDAVLRACQIQQGEQVADIGAGTGFYSRLFSQTVGPDGWVFAVDISLRFLEHIGKRVEEEKIPNLTPVIGGFTSIRLPPDSVDLIFICDTYHHFEQPQKTLESIYSALRSGGRLIVIDFERIPGVSRPFILEHVRAGKAEFRNEIVESGFRFVDEVQIDELEENYLLRFRKP